MYTVMENDMARKDHNKAHRYDLNQVWYYIASNYDYFPLFWNAYAGNIHDSRTFPEMVKQVPHDSVIIFDRRYNSADNVELLGKRQYVGTLIMSNHMDLAVLSPKADPFTETEKTVYGKKHRIIVYHSSRLQRERIMSFMRAFKRVYRKARMIIDSGDSDVMEKVGFYLESHNLNETILLTDLRIDHERMEKSWICLVGMPYSPT